MKVGDYVEKHSGDYTWAGRIAAIFTTSLGKERVVVEHSVTRGVVLHIYAPEQLRLIRLAPQ